MSNRNSSAVRPSARFNEEMFGEIVVDNFAGGGGASMGIELALGRPVDIAVNHDRLAVEMHAINHPFTQHLCQDVWRVDPVKATKGRRVGMLWASPDCKHFSRAKGGKPVEKKIRDLAWVIVKWAKLVRPRVIIMENVREFKEWGPLVAKVDPLTLAPVTSPKTGRLVLVPCPKRKGSTFQKFCRALERLGYAVSARELNAADYGAPTHRRRLFLIARCDGREIVWPEPTHGPGRPLPYRAAAECIDWSLPCPSIFLTKRQAAKLRRDTGVACQRPLKPKTLRRIALGLKRYVLDNPRPFIVNVQHGKDEFRGQAVDRPFPTVTAKHGYGVVAPYLAQNYGEAPHQQTRGQKIDEPLRTVTPANNSGVLVAPYLARCAHGDEGPNGSKRWGHACHTTQEPLPTCTASKDFAVVAPILSKYHGQKGNESRCNDPAQPANTLDTQNRFGVVSAFLAKHYGGVVGHGVERPIGTVTAVDHHSVVSAFMQRICQNGGNGNRSSGVNEPARTIVSKNEDCLVAANLVHMNHGEKQWSGCNEPNRTVTTGGHAGLVYSFLTKHYSTGGQWQGCGEPLHTVTARDRFGVVTVNVEGQPYVIADIGLRMLTPRELARAQGFPDAYVLTGSKSNQVAKIGNSVCPAVAEAVVRANCSDMAVRPQGRKAKVPA